MATDLCDDVFNQILLKKTTENDPTVLTPVKISELCINQFQARTSPGHFFTWSNPSPLTGRFSKNTPPEQKHGQEPQPQGKFFTFLIQ